MPITSRYWRLIRRQRAHVISGVAYAVYCSLLVAQTYWMKCALVFGGATFIALPTDDKSTLRVLQGYKKS